MRLLRAARHGPCDLRSRLLAPFLSGNMFHANFSTPVRAGASFKGADQSGVDVPSRRHLAARMDAGRYLVDSDPIRERHLTARRRAERGEGKLKTVIILAIVLLAIYSAVKIVPVYISNYQLSDKMQEQARFSVVNHYTEDQVRDNIFKVVQDLDIPVKREAIKVVSNNSIVKISMEYTIPVDLFFYHLDLHFSPSSENKSLL
jgi:hypothetical protein